VSFRAELQIVDINPYVTRYISSLKTEAAVDRNVERAIGLLVGEGSFVGRDNP
jgi:hypothetical protein